MTTTNQQVKLLMKKLKKHTREIAAAKAGMDVKTARKYINNDESPTDMQQPHIWKTRQDIFSEHWDEIAKLLTASPRLQAKTILAYLRGKCPDKYSHKHMRTLHRRIRDWRTQHGASQAVIFRQDIKPGKQSQSDFTNMNFLNVTINRQEFNHLLFHFMLPYSHWESVYLCFSETFDSLVLGYEKGVWELGYVAPEHRTDNLTAATKAMGSRREFTERWQQVMEYYSAQPTTNNPGVSHENGSVEKSHDTLQNAIEQELFMRGSFDFDTQKDYMKFVEAIVAGRNKQRQEQLLIEVESFLELPDKKWNSPIIARVQVSRSSVVQILHVPYTVPSRLIGYTLKAYIYPGEIVLFYGNKRLQVMPRVENEQLAGVNYRHIIDSLVRKPGAFANYQYHEALFPRLCFRRAYDSLRDKTPANADKSYLKLLQMAKLHSEQEVTEAIELLLDENQLPTPDAVKSLIDVFRKERQQVHVNAPCLTDYDGLLSSDCMVKGRIL